jgi:hypothetical protein
MHWSRDPQYSPMAPTLVRAPFHRDGWVFEEKVDGWRILAYKDGERVRLLSRNGRNHTRRFYDIAAAISKLSARASRRLTVGCQEVSLLTERTPSSRITGCAASWTPASRGRWSGWRATAEPAESRRCT